MATITPLLRRGDVCIAVEALDEYALAIFVSDGTYDDNVREFAHGRAGTVREFAEVYATEYHRRYREWPAY